MKAHKIVELGIAHVPEGRRVFSGLTVTENLKMGANLVIARKSARALSAYSPFSRG
jgi:branched-chain amino acid transport system ATP-binding protein